VSADGGAARGRGRRGRAGCGTRPTEHPAPCPAARANSQTLRGAPRSKRREPRERPRLFPAPAEGAAAGHVGRRGADSTPPRPPPCTCTRSPPLGGGGARAQNDGGGRATRLGATSKRGRGRARRQRRSGRAPARACTGLPTTLRHNPTSNNTAGKHTANHPATQSDQQQHCRHPHCHKSARGAPRTFHETAQGVRPGNT